jgi:hypothetical protein
MDPEILWEAKGGFPLDQIDTRIRLVDMGEEKILEVMLPRTASFWARFRSALKFLFKSSDVVITVYPLSEDDIVGLKKLIGK